MAVPEDEENRRIYEYFITAGLSENQEELTPMTHECGTKPHDVKPPITDIMVIFPGHGEKVPTGFTCIETTPAGFPADLNHGSLRTNSAFLCYKRGYHKPPLMDIGIMDEGKNERPMEDSTVIQYSPDGRPANVSNTSSALYFTYRRCRETGPPHQLVITDIAVVITSKGETPPHTFFKIDKNLNRAIVGSDIYVCYKKAKAWCRQVSYKPAVLACFPSPDKKSAEFIENLTMFCLPMGAVIESWSSLCGPAEQLFSTFVLTDAEGRKYYGASLTFYEKYTKELTPDQKELLISEEMDEANNSKEAEQLFFMQKAICVVSRHPFFECFRRFLYHIYIMSITPESQKLPIERYISHLMYEVPFPTPLRPRVLVQLSEEMLAFENHDDSQVPLSGAQFTEVLKCIGVDNFVYALTLALTEQKIVLHSLRPWLLTIVGETISAAMFPFSWQCPYVPQCPLSLATVIHVPCPFIAGLDSRYFDLYDDPPDDVTCFDLDTATVRYSDNKKAIKLATPPKRALKQLKATLERILEQSRADERDREKLRRQMGNDVEQMYQKRKASSELAVREACLRFNCTLMTGYSSYLKPIRARPDGDFTDMKARFNLSGFLKSRDKTATEFYRVFSETQCFNRFIQERSFGSDKVAYNAFFDDCIRKCYAKEYELLDRDAFAVNRTVVVTPPAILNPAHGDKEYKYSCFPTSFNEELFELPEIEKAAVAAKISKPSASTTPQFKVPYAVIRTKQEIRNSLETANRWVQVYPTLWPRVVLFYGYSLWFLQLPSLMRIAKNKLKVIRLAMLVLSRLNQSLAPLLDQVPFRILIQLCGEYGYPHIAVDVYREMRRLSLDPNAITYAIYHWVVTETEWPSSTRLKAIDAWKRLRYRIEVSARFSVIRRNPNFIHHSSQNVRPAMDVTLKAAVSMENMSAASVDDSAIAQSIPTTPEPDAVSSVSKDQLSEGGERRASFEQQSPASVKKDIKQSHSFSSPTSDPLSTDPLSSPSEGSSNEKSRSIYMSPSREQFLKDHSKSPFAGDLGDNIRKEKKSSSEVSWFKKLASPVVSTFTAKVKEDSRRGSMSDVSVHSKTTGLQDDDFGLKPQSQMTMSPSFSSLFSTLRIKAGKGIDVVSQQGNVLLKKTGVNSLVNEVKNLNKSYSKDASLSKDTSMNEDSILNGTAVDPESIDTCDPAFQLDSGSAGTILMMDYWMQDFMSDTNDDKEENSILIDAALCTFTFCSGCTRPIYDEEMIAGASVDDSNLNITCPYCSASFAPSLKVKLQQRVEPYPQSWYMPFTSSSYSTDDTNTKVASETLSVPFVSVLVLRREIETLLAHDIYAFADPSLRTSHPVIFWNMVYYCRRLELPTHIYTWVAKNVQIRCVYDLPEQHFQNNLLAKNNIFPLYFTNHMSEDGFSQCDSEVIESEKCKTLFKQTSELLLTSNLLQIIQTFIHHNRAVDPNTRICVMSPHFSIYRDIAFIAYDCYKRNVDREQFDRMYEAEFQKLPIRVREQLSICDNPAKPVLLACRRIFMPLDLY